MADYSKPDKTDNQPQHLTEQQLFEDTRAQLKFTLAGWYRVTNWGTGATAMFPIVPNVQNDEAKQRQLEDEWEQRSIIMHSRQYRIRLPDKPDPKSRLDPEFHQHKPRPEVRQSKTRSARLAPVHEDGTSGPDEIPSRHRTGYGTVGFGVIKV